MAAAPRLDADIMTPATDTRSTPGATRDRASLIETMRREGFRFDFYQAVRLLKQRKAQATEDSRSPGTNGQEIRFRPSSALSFPAADVRRIDVPDDPTQPPTVVVRFMGLYGVDSPLPEYFYDRIAVEEGSAAELRDFLDIFAHRLYQLFYQAWERVRPELDEARHARRFMAVAGLARASSEPDHSLSPADLIPLAGRLAPRARGAEGLTSLLKSLLDLPVRIEQHVPRWVRVDRAAGLGRGAKLAGSAMLGDRVFDVSGKFRIWLGPMDLERYLTLLPGAPGARLLNWAVRAHVPGYLDHDVVLQLLTDRLQGVRLGDRQSRLGLTTCVGKPSVAVLTRIVKQA